MHNGAPDATGTVNAAVARRWQAADTLLLEQWRDHLAEVPADDGVDMAAVITWPSRDIDGHDEIDAAGVAVTPAAPRTAQSAPSTVLVRARVPAAADHLGSRPAPGDPITVTARAGERAIQRVSRGACAAPFGCAHGGGNHRHGSSGTSLRPGAVQGSAGGSFSGQPAAGPETARFRAGRAGSDG
jgi:hypothetical protein